MRHIAFKSGIFTQLPKKSVIDTINEVLLSFTAIILTLVSILSHAILFVAKKTTRLLAYVLYTLFLASMFILVYVIIIGIYMAFNHGINNHIS